MRPKAGARSEHVRELIEEGIATSSFPPDMRLDEMDLAERFNVSRTPLREALFQQIYDGSHNEFLREQATGLHRRLRPYRRLQLRVRDRLPTSFHEHEGIVEAIIAGDADLSAQRMREHVVVQGQRFADLIASIAGLHRESMAQAANDEAQRATSGAPPARQRRL
jgi:DNA-binding GntR family transcriptional regulator